MQFFLNKQVTKYNKLHVLYWKKMYIGNSKIDWKRSKILFSIWNHYEFFLDREYGYMFIEYKLHNKVYALDIDIELQKNSEAGKIVWV